MISDKLNSTIQIQASEFGELQIANYTQKSEPFFSYLRKSGQDLSPLQYQIYRDNHLYRTLGVLPALAQALEAAAWRGDHQTVSNLGKTVYEECGESRTPHLRLLEDAFNLHGVTIYGLSPITMQEAANSPYLLSETIAFRQIQIEIFTNGKYPTLLAATYVRETAAQAMLTHFYEGIFKPWEGHYNKISVDFGPIRKFFAGHIEGVEEEHAEHAKNDALRACCCEDDFVAFKDGASRLINAQLKLWGALHKRLMELPAESSSLQAKNLS